MAKRDAPKKDNSRGRSKASDRAGTRTAANKARSAISRVHRFAAAEARRNSVNFTVPMNAMVPATELPKKFQNQLDTLHDENGKPLMVPDHRRGQTRAARATVRDARVAQSARIARKRNRRRAFAALSLAEKRVARENGRKQFIRPQKLTGSPSG